jgi:hypothetical protein
MMLTSKCVRYKDQFWNTFSGLFAAKGHKHATSTFTPAAAYLLLTSRITLQDQRLSLQYCSDLILHRHDLGASVCILR